MRPLERRFPQRATCTARPRWAGSPPPAGPSNDPQIAPPFIPPKVGASGRRNGGRRASHRKANRPAEPQPCSDIKQKHPVSASRPGPGPDPPSRPPHAVLPPSPAGSDNESEDSQSQNHPGSSWFHSAESSTPGAAGHRSPAAGEDPVTARKNPARKTGAKRRPQPASPDERDRDKPHPSHVSSSSGARMRGCSSFRGKQTTPPPPGRNGANHRKGWRLRRVSEMPQPCICAGPTVNATTRRRRDLWGDIIDPASILLALSLGPVPLSPWIGRIGKRPVSTAVLRHPIPGRLIGLATRLRGSGTPRETSPRDPARFRTTPCLSSPPTIFFTMDSPRPVECSPPVGLALQARKLYRELLPDPRRSSRGPRPLHFRTGPTPGPRQPDVGCPRPGG